jgi:stress-induced-phosphoprotein 1
VYYIKKIFDLFVVINLYQAILSDPMIQQVLRDFQENPTHANKAMSDPGVRAKIEKLIASGILAVK